MTYVCNLGRRNSFGCHTQYRVCDITYESRTGLGVKEVHILKLFLFYQAI